MKTYSMKLRFAYILALAILMLALPALAESSGKYLDDLELPQITPGKSISLQEALRLADSRNLTLAEIKTGIMQSQELLRSSWGTLLPDVYGGINYTYNDHEDTSNVGGQSIISRKQQDLDAQLSVSLPLINARQWLNISSSKANLEVSRLNFEEARQMLLYSVAQAYYQALTANSLIEVYKNQIEATRRHLAVATVRYRSGVGNRLDVTRYQSDLLSTREELIKAHYAFDNSRDALGTLIRVKGLPTPSGEIKMPATYTTSNDDLLENAMTQRFDLRAAKKSLSLSDKQRKESYMQFVPSLNASWQLSYQISDPAQDGTDRSRWFAGLVLSVPLFDFNFYPQIDQSKISKRQAEISLQQTEDNAQLEVRQARRNYEQALELVRSGTSKTSIVEESLELAETYYKQGSGSSLDVSDARKTLQNAQVNLAIKKLDVQLSYLYLMRVTGEDLKNTFGGK